MSELYNEDEDIFDKIMNFPILVYFKPLYKKNKEILLYLFFGFLSFMISVLSYALFSEIICMEILLSNVIAWILSNLFAYITNHTWVFRKSGKDKESVNIKKEILKFFTGRIGTLLIEELGLFVFIEKLLFPNMIVKIAVSMVVIILNYIIGKFWVFRI